MCVCAQNSYPPWNDAYVCIHYPKIHITLGTMNALHAHTNTYPPTIIYALECTHKYLSTCTVCTYKTLSALQRRLHCMHIQIPIHQQRSIRLNVRINTYTRALHEHTNTYPPWDDDSSRPRLRLSLYCASRLPYE